MIQTLEQILQNGSQKEITDAISVALGNSNESPFWTAKILPLCNAVLSVLLPLKAQNLLFTPEGQPAQTLDSRLFLSWCDLYSLKTLAFTLQRSNKEGSLYNTRYSKESALQYEAVELEQLGTYLSGFMIDLKNEWVDFPVTHYNLHVGLGDVLKKLF